MEVKFYKCMHCGNVAIKVVDRNVPLVCCGEPMVELVPDTEDAAAEKHVPAVSVEEGHVHVRIGSVDHPMVDDHYIQFICLVKSTGYEIHPLESSMPPASDFHVADGEKPLEVYEYCNKHGLWKCDLR